MYTIGMNSNSMFFLLLLFFRKPLIATVEKQLLGEHLTATLQKGKKKKKQG